MYCIESSGWRLRYPLECDWTAIVMDRAHPLFPLVVTLPWHMSKGWSGRHHDLRSSSVLLLIAMAMSSSSSLSTVVMHLLPRRDDMVHSHFYRSLLWQELLPVISLHRCRSDAGSTPFLLTAMMA